MICALKVDDYGHTIPEAVTDILCVVETLGGDEVDPLVGAAWLNGAKLSPPISSVVVTKNVVNLIPAGTLREPAHRRTILPCGGFWFSTRMGASVPIIYIVLFSEPEVNESLMKGVFEGHL
jgi:hypothetical protein